MNESTELFEVVDPTGKNRFRMNAADFEQYARNNPGARRLDEPQAEADAAEADAETPVKKAASKKAPAE